MEPEGTAEGTDGPSESAARAQLERILSSPDFAASERLRRFLRYVVDEALAGRAQLIKAYSIAIAVLDRDDSFDPNVDPVVRIEAGRLRRALERYYLVAGQSDPIAIEIPKGGYVPLFTWRGGEAAGADAVPAPLPEPRPMTPPAPPSHTAMPPPRRPPAGRPARLLGAAAGGVGAVAAIVLGWAWLAGPAAVPPAPSSATPALPIVQVRAYSAADDQAAGAFALGLTEELVTHLADLGEVAVTVEEPATVTGDGGRGASLDIAGRYRLEGNVRHVDEILRVTSRLVDPNLGTVLWSRAEDVDVAKASVLAIQARMATEIAGAIARPFGVVMRLEAERLGALAAGSDLDAYHCTLSFYDYREAMSAARHAEVRACLRRAVADYPRYATAWAMLSWMEIDADRFELNDAPEESPSAVERALAAARRAVAIDPDGARAQQALMMALYFSGAHDEAQRVGEQAIARHPHDAELLSEVGMRVALTGDVERGAALLRQGIAGNPARAGHYRGALAVIAYLQGDYQGSLAELQQSGQQGVGMYYLFTAMSYAQLGMMDEAHAAAERFMRDQPRLVASIDAELDRRGIHGPARARLVAGMRLAGIPVKGESVVDNRAAPDPQE